MKRKIEVWFYTGALLGIYGVLLTAAGAYQWWHPPHTALPRYHAVFWAGIVLLLVGGAYTAVYWPWRKH